MMSKLVRQPVFCTVQNVQDFIALTLKFLSMQNRSTSLFRDSLQPISDLEPLGQSYRGWEGGQDQLSEGSA